MKELKNKKAQANLLVFFLLVKCQKETMFSRSKLLCPHQYKKLHPSDTVLVTKAGDDALRKVAGVQVFSQSLGEALLRSGSTEGTYGLSVFKLTDRGN